MSAQFFWHFSGKTAALRMEAESRWGEFLHRPGQLLASERGRLFSSVKELMIEGTRAALMNRDEAGKISGERVCRLAQWTVGS